MNCEMCGIDVKRLIPVIIEGTELQVCPNCAKLGVPKEPQRGVEGQHTKYKEGHPYLPKSSLRGGRGRASRKDPGPKDIFSEKKVLVPDYPLRIRNARSKLGITQKEFAARLNERVSVIQQLERGDFRPDEKLIKKLEKALNISLKEELGASSDGLEGRGSRSGGVTIGDMALKKN